MSTLEERVAKLEEKRGKDRWDRVQVIGSVLIPLAIAFAGWRFSSSIADAQIRSAERQSENDRAIRVENTRVEQARLVSTFLEALVSESAPRRKLALKAILIALPKDGPELARIVSESDADTAVKAFADFSLRDRQAELIAKLFADDEAARKAASRDLVDGWRSQPDLIPPLLAYARAHPANPNGIYNTVGVLSQMEVRALAPYRSDVSGFLEEASRQGRNTASLAATVRARM